MMNHLSHFPGLPRPCSVSTLPQSLQQRRPFGAERFLLLAKSVIPAGEAGGEMTCIKTLSAQLKLYGQQEALHGHSSLTTCNLPKAPSAAKLFVGTPTTVGLTVASKFGFALQGRAAWGTHGVDAEGSRRQAFEYFTSSGQAAGGPSLCRVSVACISHVCLSYASTAATRTAYLGRCQHQI